MISGKGRVRFKKQRTYSWGVGMWESIWQIIGLGYVLNSFSCHLPHLPSPIPLWRHVWVSFWQFTGYSPWVFHSLLPKQPLIASQCFHTHSIGQRIVKCIIILYEFWNTHSQPLPPTVQLREKGREVIKYPAPNTSFNKWLWWLCLNFVYKPESQCNNLQ